MEDRPGIEDRRLELSEYARVYEHHDPIFKEGESGDRAFVVEEGEVEIWCERDGEKVQLQLLKAGSIFGEMSVIDGSPRSANASALGKAKVLEVTSDQLRSRLRNSDPIIRMIVNVLLERFRNERRVHRGNSSLTQNRQMSVLEMAAITGETAIHKIRLEKELQRAIEREEFALNYQPIIDLKTEEIHGFEALIRWTHPTRGPISPSEFIELAEETKLIVPLGQWVVEQACKDLSKFLDQNQASSSLFMNINFSGRQLMDRSFLAHLQEVSKKYSLSPENINIEITEGVFLAEESLSAWLSESRKNGYKIVLDDFGTGYSSLSYLSKYPIDKLKVDKSFVGHMDDDPSARAIIRAMVGVANAMNMEVVVEGIERKEQHEACLELGCDYGQGYLFSKPLKFDDILEIL